MNSTYHFYDIILATGFGFIVGVIYQTIQMLPDKPQKNSFISTKNTIEQPKKPVFPPNTYE